MLFFASDFKKTDRPPAARCSELEDHDCGNSGFPFADSELVRDLLCQLNGPKSLGLGGIHLRELQGWKARPVRSG